MSNPSLATSRPHPGSPPRPPSQPPPDPQRWRALALLCAAQFMLIVDVTVVNVALPSIARSLSLGRGGLTWVMAAYSLCFGGLLLLGGRLADGLGRRRAFLAGTALFTAASLLSGLSWNGGWLIGARAAQGVGAALMSPAAMSIITTTFHGPERNRALGVWGAIGGSGAAVGVLLGGALTAGPGWQWVFFINVPIGVAVLLLLPRLVPRGPGAGLRGLDVPGGALVTAAVGLLVYGLNHAGSDGWGSLATVLSLAGSVTAVLAFAAVEHRTPVPLIRPGLLRRGTAPGSTSSMSTVSTSTVSTSTSSTNTVSGGTLAMLAASLLLVFGFFLISWYLQHELGLSALRTGLYFLPVAVSAAVGAHTAAHVLGHAGFRRVGAAGFVLAGIGALWLARLPPHGSPALDVVPGFVPLALGLGAGFVCATTAAMHGVEHREAGLVSGIVSTGHELGSALGVALASALAGTSLTGVGAAAGVGGFHVAFGTAAALAFACAALAPLLLPAGRPDPAAGPVFAH